MDHEGTLITQKKERELIEKLEKLVSDYGFNEILAALEILASNNADNCSSYPWEAVRRNLEDSVLELEEDSIVKETN